MNMPLVLVTGGSGQVGTGIARANDGRFTLVMPTHAELDLSDAEAIATFVGSRDWAAIINCAAYTAVDRAESEPTAAYAINAEAPRAFAQACAV